MLVSIGEEKMRLHFPPKCLPNTNRTTSPCVDCTGFNLRKAMRAVGPHHDDTLHPAGIRGPQFSLPVAAKMAGPVAVTRLAEMAVVIGPH